MSSSSNNSQAPTPGHLPRVVVDLDSMTVRLPLGENGFGNYMSRTECKHLISEAVYSALVEAANIAESGCLDIGCNVFEATGVVRRTRNEIAKAIREKARKNK